jgi:hypothetical protein
MSDAQSMEKQRELRMESQRELVPLTKRRMEIQRE